MPKVLSLYSFILGALFLSPFLGFIHICNGCITLPLANKVLVGDYFKWNWNKKAPSHQQSWFMEPFTRKRIRNRVNLNSVTFNSYSYRAYPWKSIWSLLTIRPNVYLIIGTGPISTGWVADVYRPYCDLDRCSSDLGLFLFLNEKGSMIDMNTWYCIN